MLVCVYYIIQAFMLHINNIYTTICQNQNLKSVVHVLYFIATCVFAMYMDVSP